MEEDKYIKWLEEYQRALEREFISQREFEFEEYCRKRFKDEDEFDGGED